LGGGGLGGLKRGFGADPFVVELGVAGADPGAVGLGGGVAGVGGGFQFADQGAFGGVDPGELLAVVLGLAGGLVRRRRAGRR
jgi:hypothetical protein